MAKFYKVSKAFQATVSKEDKTPQVDEHGNIKFMFQVENQGKEGWMSLQRKAGSTLEAGDYVYGIVDEWEGGKAKFVRQQVPEGTEYPADAPKRSASTATASQTEKETSSLSTISVDLIHEKLDYIINILEKQDTKSAKVELEDLDI